VVLCTFPPHQMCHIQRCAERPDQFRVVYRLCVTRVQI